jgi:hypothetical protein
MFTPQTVRLHYLEDVYFTAQVFRSNVSHWITCKWAALAPPQPSCDSDYSGPLPLHVENSEELCERPLYLEDVAQLTESEKYLMLTESRKLVKRYTELLCSGYNRGLQAGAHLNYLLCAHENYNGLPSMQFNKKIARL